MASYLELANLTQSTDFQRRVTIAVVKFATFVLGEDPAVANHSSRYRWAQTAIQNATQVGGSILNSVVLDDQVQADLINVSDANLQSAVERKVGILLV